MRDRRVYRGFDDDATQTQILKPFGLRMPTVSMLAYSIPGCQEDARQLGRVDRQAPLRSAESSASDFDRRRDDHPRNATASARVPMLAPEPFFEPRGTPFSKYHRIKALCDSATGSIRSPARSAATCGSRAAKSSAVPGRRSCAASASARRPSSSCSTRC